MSTIPVFDGFQIYPTQSKNYSIEQLSQQLPQLFSNKNDRVAQFDEQLELIWFGYAFF
ncbi:unnamed protein product [Meloidogyne enterolobii]|uniref:Uncharacterized protein n=1 Tax=Meloidogyne enterolobii TaxID=390850 RepID=A0ACB0XTQ3_MELEN